MIDPFDYRQGRLHAEEVPLEQIAAEFGTPCYVYSRAAIEQTMNAPAAHPGIQHIQDIFRENRKRLYRWTLDPRIPAENNRAERELRPDCYRP